RVWTKKWRSPFGFGLRFLARLPPHQSRTAARADSVLRALNRCRCQAPSKPADCPLIRSGPPHTEESATQHRDQDRLTTYAARACNTTRPRRPRRASFPRQSPIYELCFPGEEEPHPARRTLRPALIVQIPAPYLSVWPVLLL